MKLFCKLGLHSYQLVRFRGLMLQDWLEVCHRCGKGRVWIAYGQAVQYYSATDVAKLISTKEESLNA